MSEALQLRVYDPTWPGDAARLLGMIRMALRPLDSADSFTYEHIGSTAIPGIRAKPFIDLQVCMPQLRSLDALATLLAPVGFAPATGARTNSPGVTHDDPRPGSDAPAHAYEKRLFYSSEHSSILHIRRVESPFAQFVVDFRNWLRSHPDDAARYERVKVQLAALHAGDPDYDDYTRGKTEVINQIADAINRPRQL